jgi:hypothetical protein
VRLLGLVALVDLEPAPGVGGETGVFEVQTAGGAPATDRVEEQIRDDPLAGFEPGLGLPGTPTDSTSSPKRKVTLRSRIW